jgi:hypothetical protein
MNRKIRLELADRTIITATVTSAFEAATDARGPKVALAWARGHLWLLISSTRTPSGAIGHPRSSPIYAVEL